MQTTDITKGFYKRMYSGFIKGHRINKISIEAEAWFWRILANADDFGNTHAEPLLVHQATVGRRTGVTAEMIAAWLGEMREVGLIQFYADESGDKYLHIIGHEELQPAGKNGKRVKRCPAPGDSRIIQNNPDFLDSSLASHSHSHSQEKTQEKEKKESAPKTVSDKTPSEGEGRNGKNQSHFETAAERNVRNLDDSRAYLDGLPDQGGQVDSEISPRLRTIGS